MTELSAKEVTNLYLYGVSETPENLEDDKLIRKSGGDNVVKQVDAAKFMTTGAGRFALGSEFNLIGMFFDPSFTGLKIAPGTYTKKEIAQRLRLRSYELPVPQANYKDGSESDQDYIERVYVWNSTLFKISDSAKFIVNSYFDRRIENFSIEPRGDDNFDFEGKGLAAWFGNGYLKPRIDPSGIGRKVDIKFVSRESIPKTTYDRNAFNEDRKKESDWRIWTGVPKLFLGKDEFVNNLFDSGEIRFLDSQNRPIIYGTSDADDINPIDILSIIHSSHTLLPYQSNGIVVFGGLGADIIDGGAYKAKLYGGLDNDTLKGSSEDDTFIGGEGDDTIEDELYPDDLYGGDDASVYEGVFSDYELKSLSDNVIRITDIVNERDGSDTLKGIEFAQFSDTTINLELWRDNEVPVISANNGLSLDESATSKITSEKLQVTDSNNNAEEISYTITKLAENGSLLLDGNTLAIGDTFTQADVDNDRLSYEHDGSETTSDGFSFKVADSFGGRIEVTSFNITVNPVNDSPVIDDAIFSLTENSPEGKLVGTVIASDSDVSDTSTYAITSGNIDFDSDGTRAFAIDSTTGEMTVADSGDIDFESVPNINLTVTVTDSEGLSKDGAITVNLTDIDENQPPSIISSNSFTVLENTEFVGKIKAEDVESSYLNFSIDGGADQSLFTIDSSNGDLSFNNPPNFEETLDSNRDNNYQVSVGISDGSEIVTQNLTITVSDVKEKPTVEEATFTIEENSDEGMELGIVTALDPEDEAPVLAITSGNLDSDKDNNPAFAIDSSSGAIAVNDSGDLDFETTPAFNLEVTATDAGGFASTADITVNLKDAPPAQFDTQSNNGIISLNEQDSTKVKFSLANNDTEKVNEVGVFLVDDENGSVDGNTPSSDDYLKAALERAQVIFSAISERPTGFDLENISRVLEIDGDARLGFYLVPDGTTDTVLAQLKESGTTNLPVIFSNTSNLLVSELLAEGFKLHWSDEMGNYDFTNMELDVEITQDAPAMGTKLQAEAQKELIDLRDMATQVSVSVEVHREATFDNLIGFYQIADTSGGIDTNNDGVVDFSPGQTGYKEAALVSRITGLDLLTTQNQQTTTFDGSFDGGGLLAPFIVVDGTLEEAITNNAETYFSFLGANSDKADHIRLLGDNTFGFEDLAGGDNDFNDTIVELKFPLV